MFGLSLTELFFIALVAVLVFGPERLPAISRRAGSWFAKWRKGVDNVQKEIAKELQYEEVERELQRAEESFNEANDVITGRQMQENAKNWKITEQGTASSQTPTIKTEWYYNAPNTLRACALRAATRAHQVRVCVLRKRALVPCMHQVCPLALPQSKSQNTVRGLSAACPQPDCIRSIALAYAQQEARNDPSA